MAKLLRNYTCRSQSTMKDKSYTFDISSEMNFLPVLKENIYDEVVEGKS